MAHSGRLEGKRILITGTAGGQGAAAQELFARHGARVAGCDNRDGAAEAMAAELTADGFDVSGTTVDLTNPEAAAEWVNQAADRMGGIDVVYNNAAGFGFAPFAETTLELWKHVLSVELDIVFHVTSPAWTHLQKDGGSIINVASLSALRGVAVLGQAAHSAAKGAIIGLTHTLAAEGAVDGIRCNAIAPGFIASPATAGMPEELRDQIVGMHLARRPGTASEVAFLALYLASDESEFMTGQVVSIDGGASAGWR